MTVLNKAEEIVSPQNETRIDVKRYSDNISSTMIPQQARAITSTPFSHVDPATNLITTLSTVSYVHNKRPTIIIYPSGEFQNELGSLDCSDFKIVFLFKAINDFISLVREKIKIVKLIKF